MERIPLAQRLGAPDAARLVGQYARLSCSDYFLTLDGLGGSDYAEDAKLAEGWDLAALLARIDELFPTMAPGARAHLLHRYIVAPFVKLYNKGENTNHE